MPRKSHIGALVLIVGITTVACGAADRPSVEEWQPKWESLLALMPEATDLGDPPDRMICSSALGRVRSESADLLPTSDAAIDPVVREWVRVAEATLFECPPASRALPDLASAYAELMRLEAEVSTVLEIDTQP